MEHQSNNTQPENVEGLNGLEDGNGKLHSVNGIEDEDEAANGVADEGVDEVANEVTGKEVAEKEAENEFANGVVDEDADEVANEVAYQHKKYEEKEDIEEKITKK